MGKIKAGKRWPRMPWKEGEDKTEAAGTSNAKSRSEGYIRNSDIIDWVHTMVTFLLTMSASSLPHGMR